MTNFINNNTFLDKIVYSGNNYGIPYATYGMVGISLGVFLYATLTDAGAAIGQSFHSILEPTPEEEEQNQKEEQQEEKEEQEQQKEEQEEQEQQKEEQEEEQQEEQQKEKEKEQEQDQDEENQEQSVEEEEEEETQEPGEKYKQEGGKAIRKTRKTKGKISKRKSTKKSKN
jgi:hypothetical protein